MILIVSKVTGTADAIWFSVFTIERDAKFQLESENKGIFSPVQVHRPLEFWVNPDGELPEEEVT